MNDNTYFVRTHLGKFLHPGDSVMGYMLTGTNFNNNEFDDIETSNAYGSTVPDVVLIKKHYPNRRKNHRRNWKLKRIAKDKGELLKADQERLEDDFEVRLPSEEGAESVAYDVMIVCEYDFDCAHRDAPAPESSSGADSIRISASDMSVLSGI